VLFNEQFVVKGAGKGASFAWHQDSAYVGFDHKPYLTVWIALDDTTEENGCVYLLPRNLETDPGIDEHEWQEDSKELNGYFGDEPGRPMVCPAGTVVAFSSRTLHRSGPNGTDRPRRAYIAQYSVEPIRNPESGELKRFAKPVRRAA
jgi:ectoine hydroxylase-related dioxygenase (phytanoyl-CoA dioxygenase family)